MNYRTIGKIFCITLLLGVLIGCNSKTISDDTDGNLYRIRVGEKLGFMNNKGDIVIEPMFDNASLFFSEGLCCAEIDKQSGLIDSTGLFVKDLGDSVLFWDKYHFKGGLTYVLYTSLRRGIVDKNGDFVSKPGERVRYNIDNDITYLYYKDSVITVLNGDQIGGNYDNICEFRCGMCAVKKDGRWGYIDNEGNLTIDNKYDTAYYFSKDGLARVRIGKDHRFVDKSGNEIISTDSTLSGFCCGRAAVVLNGEKYLIDLKGDKVCSIDFDSIYAFDTNDYMATVFKNGNSSKIDTNGNVILNTNYSFVGSFIDGVAPVKKNDKWGFIDTAGNVIVDISFKGFNKELHSKTHSIRAVYNEINNKYCYSYYDLKGNLVWQDVPPKKKFNPVDAITMDKNDYIDFFKSNLSLLDPIEGLYYVTVHDIYVDRDNPNRMGSNGTNSQTYAVIRTPSTNDYIAYVVDDGVNGDKKGYSWKKKFEKLGESNTYAIKERSMGKESKRYGDDTRIILENPSRFEFSIETGRNGWYNFYANYEFIKDYPPVYEYEKSNLPEWTGTGFAIADDYIVTNEHIINGATAISVKVLDNDNVKVFKGYVVASDKEHDLAIIKIVDKLFKGFGTIPYGVGMEVVDVGEDVFVLGYPMTQTMGEEIKLTTGVISSASGFKGDVSMYQISAAVQPGNSGAPLFDANGNVIGVVCAKHAEAENANYAIKMTYLYNLVKKSGIGLKLDNKNKIKSKKLNKKVKSIKDFVFIIECSSK